MNGKVLLIEDDHILAKSLAKFLEINGFKVDIAPSYEEGAFKTLDNKYDIYLIDVNLGDGNGIDLLEALKLSEDETPAIFISALKDIKTIAKSFEVGAEDYIKKPFDPEELLIRIKGRLKKKETLKYGDIIFKNGRFFKNGKEIQLGEVQKDILLKLIENRGRVVPKEILYDLMYSPSPTALRVMLNKIKKKTGIEIKAVRGIGYVID
ncbi:response regulator transcription factor [Persephonella atlantica]|uniref:Response regulator transcription factor n=1 Tax=Persephonella atlantica TaxID=2699429 RepID=A0ABS1GGU7_9AQUI|nr:response regulator transcription factor [Persephonella atlantica]MBK3332163.1 response regulator transcription factor [Persephonella atlantica]